MQFYNVMYLGWRILTLTFDQESTRLCVPVGHGLIRRISAIQVADNTYVNLVPMFAGRYVEELPWDERYSDVPFDNYTFIWNELSARGYRTLYAEDAPSIAIFNYNKAGFHRPPADYYLRPFSLAMEDHGAMWNSEHDCVGARLETDVVLDWIVEFERRFRDVPHASFSFITRLTHEDVRKAAVADRPYERFLRRLRDGGLLNRTVLVLYSDHGMRFGDLRRTYVGKLEERLPFVVVRLPLRLRKAHRQLSAALTLNAQRLTTPFDIYETLEDLKDFDGRTRYGCDKVTVTLLWTHHFFTSTEMVPHVGDVHHLKFKQQYSRVYCQSSFANSVVDVWIYLSYNIDMCYFCIGF